MSAASLIAAKGEPCQFERSTVTSFPTGSTKKTWATIGPGSGTVKGWLQPAGANLIASYGARQIEVTHKLYVASDPNVKEGDRVTIGGKHYLVAGVELDQAGVGQCWRVDVKSHGSS